MATQINGNIFRKKLSPTFDKYLRLIVYRVEPTTPRPPMGAPSEVSITGHAIRYLEAAGGEEGRGSDPGVSGKLETSGETARGCYLFCSCLTFLSLCLRLSEEVTHTLVWHHCQLKAQFFHQQFKIETFHNYSRF